MRLKMLLATLALTAVPTLALAEGCRHGNMPRVTASSCGEGQVWNIITQSCVAGTSS